MPQTKEKVLPLGKPRATKYLEIIAKRDGKRRAAQVEKKARELAAATPDARVVRFEFVAEAAGVTLEQMADELAEHGIRTSPSNVRHGTLNGERRRNGKTKAPEKKEPAKAKAATSAGKGGPGNARKATASKGSSPTKDSSSSSKPAAAAKPDPKHKRATGSGSAKRSASSRKPAGSRGRAAGSSLSKSAQMRQLREKQASAKS